MRGPRRERHSIAEAAFIAHNLSPRPSSRRPRPLDTAYTKPLDILLASLQLCDRIRTPNKTPPAPSPHIYNGEWVGLSCLRAYQTETDQNRWAPFIGLVVVVAFCAAAWFLSPKGENQTYVHPSYLHRNTLHPTSSLWKRRTRQRSPSGQLWVFATSGLLFHDTSLCSLAFDSSSGAKQAAKSVYHMAPPYQRPNILNESMLTWP
jgi:hypothetical protein